ncbi:glycoside hydrolase family 2 sugar binding [Tepidicaulis marinus]|uniref:Glycoside hydrolase family 2 sugar binding n=1 Tax=Tepidicaulis marinus TaxID=1333998 RepID=A0A081BFG6_9HYPH|nr:hypothetical protein [Tepidicaulis marinus]GAK46784.1 glycoside hydrolase family 2 sugar binding [Tepidicaulis marinus]
MAQRPALFRAIYAELRRGLGKEVYARDLAKLAHLILQTYLDDNESESDWVGRASAGRSIRTMAVDDAMKDGGWRILEFETHRAFSVDDINVGEFNSARAIIEKYLGPEWQHHKIQGQL